MTRSHIRRLHRLLETRGYVLAETNAFGVESWQQAGCLTVTVLPGSPANVCAQHARQVERDTADPETTPEWRAKKAVWDAEEAARVERVKADAQTLANLRTGTWADGLSESEIAAIADLAEQNTAANRQFARSMRHYPSEDIGVAR